MKKCVCVAFKVTLIFGARSFNLKKIHIYLYMFQKTLMAQ